MKTRRTIQQIETAKDRAVRFLRNVLQDDERADQVDDESPEDYAERRGIQVIENPLPLSRASAVLDMLNIIDTPTHARKSANMSQRNPTKSELNDLVNEASEKVSNLLDPELTREDMVRQAKELDELLNGSDDDDDEEDQDEDEDEDEE